MALLGTRVFLRSSLAAAPSRLAAPSRAFGIMDTLQGWTSKSATAAVDKKRVDVFTEQLKVLTDSPVYGLAEHCGLLATLADKAGVNGWRTMLLSEAQKADLAEQLIDLKIGDALTPAERADPRSVTHAVKVRIATSLGTTVERTNKFLDAFNQSSTVHKWLQGRKSKGA